MRRASKQHRGTRTRAQTKWGLACLAMQCARHTATPFAPLNDLGATAIHELLPATFVLEEASLHMSELAGLVCESVGELALERPLEPNNVCEQCSLECVVKGYVPIKCREGRLLHNGNVGGDVSHNMGVPQRPEQSHPNADIARREPFVGKPREQLLRRFDSRARYKMGRGFVTSLRGVPGTVIAYCTRARAFFTSLFQAQPFSSTFGVTVHTPGPYARGVNRNPLDIFVRRLASCPLSCSP